MKNSYYGHYELQRALRRIVESSVCSM